jgi:uncharacterized protein YicC (UPF0701 family)
LPEEFHPLENNLRARATAVLGRGKIEAGLRFNRSTPDENKLSIDINRLHAVLAALQQVSAESRTSAPPDAMALLSFPGVMHTPQIDHAPVLAAATELFGWRSWS